MSLGATRGVRKTNREGFLYHARAGLCKEIHRLGSREALEVRIGFCGLFHYFDNFTPRDPFRRERKTTRSRDTSQNVFAARTTQMVPDFLTLLPHDGRAQSPSAI